MRINLGIFVIPAVQVKMLLLMFFSFLYDDDMDGNLASSAEKLEIRFEWNNSGV